MSLKHMLMVAAVAMAGLGVSGCFKPQAQKGPQTPAKQVVDDGHGPDGWWCNEHGVPEEVCTRCDAKLVADFKAKGDWCKEHERPDSQCFLCHPEKEAEFAADYKAHYGKDPPKPTDG